MMLGSHQRRYGARRRQAERQLELWQAYPTEGKIALVAVPAAVLLGTHLIHLVPGIDAILGNGELGAIGTLMALFSVLLIELTFGRVARRNLAEHQTLTPRLGRLSDDGILTGAPVRTSRNLTVVQRLDLLQQHDPGFSERLVGVFSRALLLRAGQATSEPAATALLPYASPSALEHLHALLGPVDRILPGPARIADVEEAAVWTTLAVEQPCLVAHGGSIRHLRLTLTLRRTSAARSPSPVDLAAFACPACGAPVEVTHPDGLCTTCQTAITHGQLCWQLVAVEGMRDAPAWPEGVPRGGEHPSALLPTVEDPQLVPAMRGLATRHPEVSAAQLEHRACTLAVGWLEALIAGRPDPVAEACTEELLAALRYEIGRLRAGRLTLTGGPVAVDHAEWIRCGRDGWHELAALRVFLRTPWHIRDAEGRTVDGDPEVPRELSLVIRLVHPTAETTTLAGWKLWQVVDPRRLTS